MKDNKKLSKIDKYKFWEIAFEINKKVQILKIYNKQFFSFILNLKEIKRSNEYEG